MNRVSAIKRQLLGDTHLDVSVIGFGTSKIASMSGGLSARAARRLLEEAFDLGINLFDTADCYGQGDAERRVGEFVRQRRSECVVASKSGYRFSGSVHWLARLKPFLRPILQKIRSSGRAVARIRAGAPGGGLIQQDFSPAYLDAAVRATLARMRTGHLDVFFLHEPPPGVACLPEIHETMSRLRKEGLVRFCGVSSGDPAVLAEVRQEDGWSVVQSPINRQTPPASLELLERLRLQGIGIFASQPFGSGALLRGGEPVEALLQGVLARGVASSVLIGTTSAEHLRQNCALIGRLQNG